MIISNPKIVVYGAGSWGTALANHVASIPKNIHIFSRNPQTTYEINNEHKNSYYLGNILLNSNLYATSDENIIKDADIIIIAIPSSSFANIIETFIGKIKKDTILLIATKGLADKPVRLFSDFLKDTLDNPFAFISGPNFAAEVAMGKEASVTISSEDIFLAKTLQNLLETKIFEISTSDDIITQQIAGIVKNIIAIKSGIVSSKGQGENARATLLTKGLREIMIISNELGGKFESILEPSVLGDLILTGYSATSRNTKFGFEFHKNGYSTEFVKNYPILVEGIEAARLISILIDINKLDLPVIKSVVELFVESSS